MKFKNVVLGIGIVIMYALVLWQGVEAFYPAPLYEDFCQSEFPREVKPYQPGVVCPSAPALDAQADACWRAEGMFVYEYDDTGCAISGYCDECPIEYNDAMDQYSRNIFIIALIVGVITFILGFVVLSVEPVGSALLASGVWALFYGTVVNWRNFGTLIRFVLLLLVLVILIWVALRLNTRGYLFKKKTKHPENKHKK